MNDNNAYFEIAIPKEFLLKPDDNLDYHFRAIVHYHRNGLISDISAPWSTMQYVDWNAKGLEDYFVGAIKNAQEKDTIPA